jgi:alcohol dehydrogenase (cytochrome c)
MFYVLDRTNGAVLRTGKLSTKVTWLKGFTPDGKPIIDPGSVASKDGVAVCPGGGGGTNFPAASYNPITKLFYTRVADSCQIFTSHEDPLGVSGNRWFGRGSPGEKSRQVLAELMKDYEAGRFIRAMSPFTATKAWDFIAPDGRSGVMSTASGLIFVGGGGGLMVHDGKTGKLLKNINLSQSTEATPMTYMVGGKQYIGLAGSGTVTAYVLY